MAVESYYIGAYWGVRPQTLPSCAAQALRLTRGLRDIDPAFSHWYELGESEREALQREIPLEEPALEGLLENGRSRHDDGAVIEDLGFRVHLCVGTRGALGTFRLACGGYSPYVPNSCVVQLPWEEPMVGRLLQVDILTAMLRLVVHTCDPEFAVVNSQLYVQVAPQRPPGVPVVGWLTYLARPRASVPPVPPPARIESCDDSGTLIIATDGRFTVGNPAHVAAADGVATALEKAGLLQRTF